MGRTRLVTWSYQCDADNDAHVYAHGFAILEVHKGERCDTGRGTVVHDQQDADAVARQQGWTVGRRVLCPACWRGGR